MEGGAEFDLKALDILEDMASNENAQENPEKKLVLCTYYIFIDITEKYLHLLFMIFYLSICFTSDQEQKDSSATKSEPIAMEVKNVSILFEDCIL